uniref:Uncharacterized protein n=1 Tax=Latimeria chalumnae TaxID=7897 RepID=H3A8P4_LATCH
MFVPALLWGREGYMYTCILTIVKIWPDSTTTVTYYIRVCGMLSQWCKAKRFGARMAKLLNILEFLQDEAGKGVACITLKFKVSAIGAIGGDFEGFALSSHSLLSLFFFFFFFFFKALHHLKTPFRSIVPSWDLNLVLSTLCEAPLDPM